jgi:hypothetical protein
MGKLELRLDAVARVKDRRQLIELQTRLHDALNFYFGIKSKYQFIVFFCETRTERSVEVYKSKKD